jgi:hypothetical protein
MNLKLCVAALAVAVLFSTAPAAVNSAHASDITSAISSQPRIDISRIKSVLKLTPEQQAYWPPVEAALRKLVRGSAASEDAGLVKRISARVSSYVLDGAAIARIGAAARPLVKMLDDRQKQDAVMLVQEMGLGQILTALL